MCRPYDTDSQLSGSSGSLHDQVSRLVFFTYLRMTTYKESKVSGDSDFSGGYQRISFSFFLHGMVVLGKPHSHSAPSLSSLPQVALVTVLGKPHSHSAPSLSSLPEVALVIVLGKPHLHSAPSLSSLSEAALETVPVCVWLTSGLFPPSEGEMSLARGL